MIIGGGQRGDADRPKEKPGQLTGAQRSGRGFANASASPQSFGEYGLKFSRQPHICSSEYVWQRSVKPSAQPCATVVAQGQPDPSDPEWLRAGMADMGAIHEDCT
jgi:hypothetical protein